MKRNVGFVTSVTAQCLLSDSTAAAIVTMGELWNRFFNIFSYSLFGPQ